MRNYQYPLPTGQIIVSPVELSYAYDPALTVDLKKVIPTDFKKISILADEKMADIVTELSDGKQWRTPAAVLSQPMNHEVSQAKNYCLIQNGTIYVRDGRKYAALDTILKNGTREELEFVLRNVAYQASICQAALAGEELTSKSPNEAV